MLAERALQLLNAGVKPVVQSVGSVEASGDLAPLAHAALVLIGEGEATFQGRRLSGAEAMRAAGLEAVHLEAKEGLALINGTHLMAAMGALTLADVDRLFAAALCAAAMSIDACRGTDAFLDARVHAARGQPGQAEVAARLAALIAGSQIVSCHLHNDPRVQDPYSLRCAPQVLGAALEAIRFARGSIERELGAVTDNPLIFAPDPAHRRQVVAIELLCAAEALEYQRPLRSGAGVETAHATVRSVVSKRTADRPPATDIAALERLILEERFAA